MRLIFLYRRHHLKWRDDLQNVSQQFQIEANLELVNLWMDVEVLLSPQSKPALARKGPSAKPPIIELATLPMPD